MFSCNLSFLGPSEEIYNFSGFIFFIALKTRFVVSGRLKTINKIGVFINYDLKNDFMEIINLYKNKELSNLKLVYLKIE